MRKYKIADIIVEIECLEELMSECLCDFECSADEPAELHWSVICGSLPDFPAELSWTQLAGFDVAKSGDRAYARYNNLSYYMISAIVYEDDYKKATLYIKDSIENKDEKYISDLKNIILVFEREMFFFALLNLGGISIHSASIIYKGCGIVFSALSGTGKSTHTNMWHDIYDTPILDGDVTVCRIIDGKPYIYGLPWSGTSNLFVNERVELKAVVFLSQAKTNKVTELALPDFAKRLLARSFTPRWFVEIIHKEISYIQKIIDTDVKSFLLECDISKEAVDTVKQELDSKCFF